MVLLGGMDGDAAKLPPLDKVVVCIRVLVKKLWLEVSASFFEEPVVLVALRVLCYFNAYLLKGKVQQAKKSKTQ
jgi:hypothetical protein